MKNLYILSVVTFGYLGSFVLYLIYLIFQRNEKIGKIASLVLWLTFITHTVGIILRWIESYQMGIGHAPLSNLYESLIFFAWTIGLIYIVIEKKFKNKAMGAFAVPFAFLSMAYASFSPSVESRIQPLIPALQSNWLIAHVITCFLGYAAFAVGCAMSIMYLIQSTDKEGRKLSYLPNTKTLDLLTSQVIMIGFILLTVGIITGSIWAESAWGAYWSWDPKETWSLITWLLYAALLHFRMVSGWKGKRIAYFSILGFASVLFTYFGVNFILSGLHSYAT